ESHKQEIALIAQRAAEADIVITTALIPGKPAPLLLSEGTVKQMKSGSVIVDLAAEAGGNCELTEAGKEVEKSGVKIIGLTNLPSLMAEEASRLYARNVMGFLFEISKKGVLELDRDNEIVKGTLVTEKGEVVHPAVQKLMRASRSS
ncbi:MAG TPA: NAD(P)(+) transhydrogenase (Re/Si-specific) subunit alpha, partial [bacterium]|nr:NAD(P)(+) transhydrogenase (Re/Si-specific) subunit alpha [bacterium]